VDDVERLHEDLAKRFSDRKVEFDPSETDTGSSFISVSRDGGLPPVVVEWRPEHGFGLSTPGPDDFGAGVDEAYPSAEETYDRVVRLVLSGNPSVPTLGIGLAELRQIAGLTQSELADRLGIKQANVSKAENREDLQLGTLRRIVEALGYRLSVRASKPDGTRYEIDMAKSAPALPETPSVIEVKTGVSATLQSANPDIMHLPAPPNPMKLQN
jgi:transcriptional regulator with XRE-family HTH domain